LNSGNNFIEADLPVTIGEIIFMTDGSTPQEIDFFGDLVVGSIDGTGAVDGTYIGMWAPSTILTYSGVLEGSSGSLLVVFGGDAVVNLTYTGPSTVGSGSMHLVEPFFLNANPTTVYCFPDCQDDGPSAMNTNIVFGPEPSPPSATCALNSMIPGLSLTTLFILFIGVGILLAIIGYLGLFGGYGTSVGSAITDLEYGPKGWIAIIVAVIVIVVVSASIVNVISC
jgi:hypothetical protein